MKLMPSLLGGLAGAVTVTLMHELLKRNVADAPRMDKLGMQAISKGMQEAELPVPDTRKLFATALLSELAMNTLYYSLAGIGKRSNAERKGSLLGFVAGLGSIFLPKPLGLNEKHSNKTFRTKMLAMGLYLLGGYIASAVGKLADKPHANA